MNSETNTSRIAIAAAVVLLAAAAFWLLLLSPKRKEADEWASKAEAQQLTLTEAQSKAAEAGAARKTFPDDYREMVLLGKAVPEGDETAALIVQIAALAHHTHVKFGDLTLESGGEGAAAPITSEAGASSSPTPVPPAEVEKTLLPLGASLGSSDLAVMPYKLSLTGNFTQTTEFIAGIESLIDTKNEHLSVDGRLMILSAFSLTPAPAGKGHKDDLASEMKLTTFLVPPATEASPESLPVEEEIPVSPEEGGETTTASPSAFSSGGAQ